jgi:replicative DNA helicase
MPRPNWLPDRLPEDLEAERSFLATCCAPGSERLAGEVIGLVRAKDFVHPAHQIVYTALVALLQRGEEVHALSLKAEIEQAGSLNRVGGYPGLVEVLTGEDVGRPHRLAEIIREKARHRQLIHIGAELVRRASIEADTSGDMVAQVMDVLSRMAMTDTRHGLVLLSDVGDRAMAHIQDVREGRALPGIPTRFPRLDGYLAGGFKAGQIVILAARPGVGKSTLLSQWLIGMAEHLSRVALFALEMADVEIWTRMAGGLSRISGTRIASGSLGDHDMRGLESARAELGRLPFHLCDRASITTPEIRALLSSLVAVHPDLAAVGIDYLQLLSSPEGSRSSKQNEAVRIGEISRSIKLMAKDLNLPVIVLSQLNREVEHRSGGRPQLSDLRDSGAVEQDADVVLFLHRRGEPGPDASYELIIAKNRNGPTGVIPLVPDLEHFRFLEASRETDPPHHSSDRLTACGEDL